MRRGQTLLLVLLIGSLISVAGCRFGPMPPMPDIGKMQLARGALIQADERALTQILDTFHQADEALQKQDLEGLIKIYSPTYKYHGYDKDRLRLLWEDLFRLYDRFSATHVFSKIVVNDKVNPPTAEITCTGSLWAISKLTGRRVNIDSWFGDVHYLIYEDGAWRMRGHAWELPDPGRFVLSPHPFF
jgi:hypothetical protein